jgi:hypothetical protein
MRTLLAAIFCAALAACGQQSNGDANVAAPAALTGEFRAVSDAARTMTGDLSVERAGLIFDRGVVLYTRTLERGRAGDSIARDGESYAALLVGAVETPIELRRVVEQSLTGGAQSLCGAERPDYVALAADEQAGAVTVFVFAGGEPPGPVATDSRLCGRFKYAGPAGVRTRQGVVLW